VLLDLSRIGEMDEDSGIVQRKIILQVTADCNIRQLHSMYGFNVSIGKGKLWSVSCMEDNQLSKLFFPLGKGELLAPRSNILGHVKLYSSKMTKYT
jgi:hypothetical protein